MIIYCIMSAATILPPVRNRAGKFTVRPDRVLVGGVGNSIGTGGGGGLATVVGGKALESTLCVGSRNAGLRRSIDTVS